MAMRIYGAKMLPNPRRVAIYLAEKGMELEWVYPDLEAGEQRSPEFLKKNPAAKIPVLELDDGTCLTESAAIIEYLEELNPFPPMIGGSAVERAKVRALERIASDVYIRLSLQLQHTHPFFKERRGVIQFPEVGTALQASIMNGLLLLETHMGNNEFFIGASPTIADISFFATIQTSNKLFKYELPSQFASLRRWYDLFCKRPSATVSL